MSVVEITYFSDVLCVWAYASQARIDAVREKFGDAVRIEHRFCSVFGDTAGKIASTWKDRGGYEGFNSYLRQVAERFPHIVELRMPFAGLGDMLAILLFHARCIRNDCHAMPCLAQAGECPELC